MNPYHSLLSTPEQAKQDVKQLISDHLPVLFEVQSAKMQTPLRVITFNLFVPDQGSGFYPQKETDNEVSERYKRIVKSIEQIIDRQRPHIICFQEEWLCTENEDTFKNLCDSLEGNWQFTRNKHGQATLFNADCVLNAETQSIEDPFWRYRSQEIYFTYFDKDTNQQIPAVFCNTHIPHEHTPETTEAKIKELLIKHDDKLAVVCGDFNSRFFPVGEGPYADEAKRNLINNVVSAEFRDHKQQGADCTDGLFYRSGSNQKIIQAVAETIDPVTGDTYGEDKHIGFDKWFEGLDEVQRQEVMQPKMHLCLDEAFSGQDIQGQEEQLRKISGCEGLIVRFARNLCNEKFVGIAFNPKNKRKLGLNPKLPEQNYLNSIKPFLNDLATIQLVDYDIDKSLAPMIFVHPEHFSALISILNEHQKLQKNTVELEKLIQPEDNKLPATVSATISSLLEQMDAQTGTTGFNLADANKKLSEMMHFAKASTYIDAGLIKGVVNYVRDGGDIEAVLDFVDDLTKMVEQWVDSPPENTAYAKELLTSILKDGYIFEKYNRIEPLKSRLYYLQGLINLHGICGLEKKTKQAQYNFLDAGINGSEKAYIQLGHLSLAAAKEEHSENISDSASLVRAIDYYKQGGRFGLFPLSETALHCYRQNLQSGDMTTAKEFLDILQTLVSQHPTQKLAITSEALNLEKEDFLKLQHSISDTIMIEAHFIKCQTLNEDVMEERFLDIRSEIIETGHSPAFDYYYMQILKTKLRLGKNSLTEDKKEAINNKINELCDKLSTDNQYSQTSRGQLYFIYGLALRDGYNDVTRYLPEKQEKIYFKLAISKGFHVAYSYYANIIEMDNTESLDSVERCYRMGALAGDPRAQISYFHRFLQQRIKGVIGKNAPVGEITTVCEEMLMFLRLAVNNPHLIEENRPVIEDYIKSVKETQAEYSYYAKHLSSKAWHTVNDKQLKTLKNKIAEYNRFITKDNKLDLHADNKVIINYLYEIKDLNEEAINKFDRHFEKILKQLSRLQKQVGFAIDFIEKEISSEAMRQLSSLSSEQLDTAKDAYFSKEGHIDESYYLEYIDPLHRVSPQLKKVWSDSIYANEPFNVFLSQCKDIPKNMVQVTYLNQSQKAQLHVTLNEGKQISYQHNKQPLEDGKYLYVLTAEKQLYVAKETHFKLKENCLFQHTSMSSGNYITCAGELIIKDGGLSNINNGSGHYRPTSQQLEQARDFFFKEGYIKSEDSQFTMGVFGVTDIDGFSDKSLLNLTLEQYNNVREKIIQVEQQNRDIAVFNQLLVNQLVQKEVVDPNQGRITENPVFTDFLHMLQKAKSLVIDHQASLLEQSWSPSFFNSRTVAVAGNSKVLPKAKAAEIDIITEASNSHDWLSAAVKLNLIPDKRLSAILDKPEVEESKRFFFSPF